MICKVLSRNSAVLGWQGFVRQAGPSTSVIYTLQQGTPDDLYRRYDVRRLSRLQESRWLLTDNIKKSLGKDPKPQPEWSSEVYQYAREWYGMNISVRGFPSSVLYQVQSACRKIQKKINRKTYPSAAAIVVPDLKMIL
jgi:hypothetical protein